MTDETCCGACGYPIHATKESACDWCRKSADRIEALIAERDEAWKRAAHAEKMWGEAEVKLAKAVEALDDLLEAITAEDRFGDRSLTITGSTANLKWLLDAEDTARATLAEIKVT
jgi:hypothetical protein